MQQVNPVNATISRRPTIDLPTAELDYDLPASLIATHPAEPRDSARLMVVHQSSDTVEHRHVRDLQDYIRSGDSIVFNTTSVVPARLLGRRVDTGGRVEGLFLREVSRNASGPIWRIMLKAGGRLRPGVEIEWLTAGGEPSAYRVQLMEQDEGEWIAGLNASATSLEVLDRIGRTPLPPYILHARAESATNDAPVSDEQDRRWYQTVYAAAEQRASVAAPTAGLHFTPELLAALQARGVQWIDVTLHVGPGTFKPVTADNLAQHHMHSEWIAVSPESVSAIRQTRDSDPPGRIIAVGTTSARTLESLPSPLPEKCGSIAGMTDLMIAPPYDFRLVDGLLTNFHLPRSTLLALVGAMMGLDRLKAVYREAIRREYRFYSYGDAMLILP